jgi:hypothetical protein
VDAIVVVETIGDGEKTTRVGEGGGGGGELARWE